MAGYADARRYETDATGTGVDRQFLFEVLVPVAAFPLWWVLYFC